MPRGGSRAGAGRRSKVDLRAAAEESLVGYLETIAGHDAVARRTAIALAAYGCPGTVIAAAIGVDVDRLTADFADEIETGRNHLNGNILEALHRRGMQGNVGAATAFLKFSAGS
jgi:hypothetical protein